MTQYNFQITAKLPVELSDALRASIAKAIEDHASLLLNEIVDRYIGGYCLREVIKRGFSDGQRIQSKD